MIFYKTANGALGYGVVEFLQFNYDGCGGAIIIADGKRKMCSLHRVNAIVFGDDYELQTEEVKSRACHHHCEACHDGGVGR